MMSFKRSVVLSLMKVMVVVLTQLFMVLAVMGPPPRQTNSYAFSTAP